MLGTTAVRGWPTNQAVIALSSGEAEYYAALKGASSALGYQSMLRDIGMHATVTLHSDSSAARGIIHRAGLGKLRHLETRYLWLQSAVAKKRLQVRKVNGAKIRLTCSPNIYPVRICGSTWGFYRCRPRRDDHKRCR